MLFTILGKILGSALGFLCITLFPEQIILVAAVLGIAPIWTEVIISILLKIEPGSESRFAWIIIDNFVDHLCFIVFPISYFYFFVDRSILSLIGIILFIAAGTFRILRFVRIGLFEKKYFLGLPVTYTGYLWPLLTYLSEIKKNWSIPILLFIASCAMITKKIKIKSL